MIRILIAEDHAIVRGGLKQIFALASDIHVAAEAINGSEVLEQLRNCQFDLLLMDMTMPGISGVDLITRVTAHRKDIPVLVLSMHNEPQMAARALKVGASGYITKDSDPECLIEAIRKVAGGGKYIDPSLAEQMVFDTIFPAQRLPHALLSDREFDVFRLLAAGKRVGEIAEQLAISNKTVSTHKLHLMEKMNLSNTADLVRYAIQYDLIR